MEQKKNMTIMELEGILGDRVRRTLEPNLTPEQRQIENEKSALIVGLAKQIINGADLVLRTEKLLAQTECLTDSCAMKLIKGDE